MAAATLSTNEVAALLDLPERQVRKDIEYGLVDAGSPPRVGFPTLVYFQALRLMELKLGVQDRKRLLQKIRDAMELTPKPDTVELASVLSLHIGPLVKDLSEKLEAFNCWKDRLVVSPEILGGEPVFPNSRLAVRRVGALALRESVEVIREDYPYLSEQDVNFAGLYARAYPRVGRPPA